MVDISIIIVNYNVQQFLKQCLQSIYASVHNLSVEVIVVDNNSVDGSISMMKKDFPSIRLIENAQNLGFSKANNIGIGEAKGRYVLLLNPDTLLEEDCLQKCFEFSEREEKIGAIGVKLLDGKGAYLPESKRGFPSPWISIAKFTGLGKLFSKSSFFNGYYMGHLSSDETTDVDVLCGAFMFIPSKVLDDVGLLDEAFFMYGEDIDLSYRIQESGYRVVYFPQTSIIHFKGESTKKASYNYVKTFYGAMKIFAKKHTKGNNAAVNLWFLNTAIIVLGVLSFLKSNLTKILPLILDLVVGTLVVFGVSYLWQVSFFNSNQYFSDPLFYYFIGGVVALLVLILYIIGHYDRDAKKRRFIMIGFISLLLMLSIYGLLPSEVRFSRTVISISTLLLLFTFFNTRKLWNKIRYGVWRYEKDSYKRILIVGNKGSAESLIPILNERYRDSQILGVVAPDATAMNSYYINSLDALPHVSKIMKVNEIIFCTKDLGNSNIFSSMALMGGEYSFKLANTTNDGIVGSTDKKTTGDWFTEDIQFNIDTDSNHRIKRLFDIGMTVITLVLFPLFAVYSKGSRKILSNAFKVLIGRLTWIGYDDQLLGLPSIKSAVMPVLDLYRFDVKLAQDNKLLAMHYAKNYSVVMDFEMFFNFAFR